MSHILSKGHRVITMPARTLWVIGAMTFAVLAGAVRDAAQAADPPARAMREIATLPEDKNIRKRFGAIKDYLAEKRYSEAIEVLQEIAQTDGRLLVQVDSGTPATTAAYVNVAQRCNILLAELPPEALVQYRRKVDPQARRWLDQWRQSHDEADLLRVVRSAYLSSAGDDALWALGETAWDRGDLSAARLYWTQLVPLGQEARAAHLPTVLRYPDTDLNIAEVLARLVLCSLLEGDRSRAAEELVRFRELAPGAEGVLAGRQGRLVDLVQQVLDESTRWDLSNVPDAVPTFGLNSARGGTMPERMELGASKWSHALPANRLPTTDRGSGFLDRGPLSYNPVTYGDVVFVNNARSIWAWNLLTGEPAWPSDRGTAEIYPPAPDDVKSVPSSLCVGAPHYTMTVAEGRLYARMGSVVTNPAEGPSEAELTDSDLVCLDLEHGQGRLLWKVSSQEQFRDDPNPWRFEGSPVVLGGRAYVALSRRRPQLEFAVACLDASSGAFIWHRPVATSRTTLEDHQNRVSHLLLTAGAGKLFLSTDGGAILALSASDGRLEWAVTYESNGSTRTVNPASSQQQGLLPPLFHEGLLFVAPNDCSRLLCLEADSGRVRWQIKHPEPDRWRHLLGVVPGGTQGRLLVSGRSLWSIDIATHGIVFGRSSGPRGLVSVEQGYGRGVIADSVVLWPVREAIQVIDAQTGTPVGEKSLQLGGGAETGGNLVACRGMLLVAQPDRLVAYCEYSVLKLRLERELSERIERARVILAATTREKPEQPVDVAGLYWQLSDLEYAQGNLVSAVEVLRRALDVDSGVMRDDMATVERVRSRLVELYRQLSRSAVSEGHPAIAVEQLHEARAMAQRSSDLIAVLFDLGDAELNRGRTVEALEAWQEVLDRPDLRGAAWRDSSAGATASFLMAQLIQSQGRGIYTRIERRAVDAIAASGTNDVELRATLEQYPHASVVRSTWHRLAETARRDRDYQQALQIYARLDSSQDEAPEAIEIGVGHALTLEAAGYWRAAAAVWQRIAALDKDVVVEIAGERGTAGELARRQLNRPEYRHVRSGAVRQSTFLDHQWQVSLSGDANPDIAAPSLLTPRESPPSMSLACLLVRRSEQGLGMWECLDRQTGAVRWRRAFASAPQWCEYGSSHLLVATGTDVMALTLEAGQPLWSAPLPGSVPAGAERFLINESVMRNATDPGAVVVRLALRRPWLVLLEQGTGLSVLDINSGQCVWTFLPPRGKLQTEWSCQGTRVALQTIQPSLTWLVTLGAQRQVTERPGTADPWLAGPDLGEETSVMLTADRRIECRQLRDGQPVWTFQGGMSFAHTNPRLWSVDGQLLLAVDGTTLSAINRTQGRTDWSVGLAARPLTDPALQIVTTDHAAFAANSGLLRRISLQDGTCSWEQYLGGTSEQWQIAAEGRRVAAWPQVPDGAGRPTGAVVLCDARTGRITQRIPVRDSRLPTRLAWDETGCLIWNSQRVDGYVAAAETDGLARMPSR